MSAGTGPVSAQERERIFDLAEKGLKRGRIAQLLGRNKATVSHYLVVGGFVPATPAGRRSQIYFRNGRPVRAFSAEEDRFIERLDQAGVSHSAIGRACARFGAPRKPHVVKYRLCQLAAAAELAEAGR